MISLEKSLQNSSTNVKIKNGKIKKNDKRNLILANEVCIERNSIASKGIPINEMNTRLNLELETRTRLEKNVNLFVSPVRLSVKNLNKNGKLIVIFLFLF